MLRALFEKTGRAVYISHLDLMRLFQRAFQRAGLPLTHGQGFNPRPFVSIALPMSLGMESRCELLEFQLDGVEVPGEEICRRLNDALVEGVRVLEVYEGERKLKCLSLLRCRLTLEYDRGIPEGAEDQIDALFRRERLMVEKKGKNGIVEQDILPMLKSWKLERLSPQELALEALICCQNPALNPMQLEAAIRVYLPELAPDFTRCCRLEIYDPEQTVFR